MKVSIKIPCYNVEEKLIDRCLASIEVQTLDDYEIILVNDGSNEVYSDILRAKANKHIKLIEQENTGVSSARNKGTLAACGDYVCYVDADDVVTADYLRSAYQVAMEEKADLIIGGNGFLGKTYASSKKKNG